MSQQYPPWSNQPGHHAPQQQTQRGQHPLVQLPPKKTKKWPWVLGIVAAFIVGAGVGAAGSGATPAPATAAGGDAGATSASSGGAVFSDGPYRLEAVSEAGARISVIYANGTGGIDQDTVNSGWTMEIPNGTQYNSGTFSVSTSADWAINNGDASDTLTCRIYEGDDLITEQSGTGQHANATCSGY